MVDINSVYSVMQGGYHEGSDAVAHLPQGVASIPH